MVEEHYVLELAFTNGKMFLCPCDLDPYSEGEAVLNPDGRNLLCMILDQHNPTIDSKTDIKPNINFLLDEQEVDTLMQALQAYKTKTWGGIGMNSLPPLPEGLSL